MTGGDAGRGPKTARHAAVPESSTDDAPPSSAKRSGPDPSTTERPVEAAAAPGFRAIAEVARSRAVHAWGAFWGNGHVDRFVATLEPRSRRGALTVLLACTVVAFVLWVPLYRFARVASRALCLVGIGECGMPSTSRVDMLVMGVVTLAVALSLFAVRRRLRPRVEWAMKRLPERVRFLVPPVVATGFFALGWVWMTHQAPGQWGFAMTNRFFPVAVGLLTYVSMHWTPELQVPLERLLNRRDRLSRALRMGATLGIALVASLMFAWTASLFTTAFHLQFSVLAALVVAWVLLAPRRDVGSSRTGGFA